QRRIRAWTMYDWANSAFATTILAAVLPIYYSQVAGDTLPSAAVATAYWTAGLSIALFIVALISPILGTISDIRRGKKRFLSISVGFGVVATGLLVLVGSGDWLLASILFIVGRVGFGAANVFYDALLPHVAREEDQDRVSTRGYAMGYLGGGLLLAVNAVMIFVIGPEGGARLSFLSVAVWWAVFSIPIMRRVPEPPSDSEELAEGESILSVSFGRLKGTLTHIRRFRQLFRFLIAFLIYNDGIGTIIGVAAIYGAELGFGATELILALLLVQFVGIPFALIFGRIPDPNAPRRQTYLAFVVFNLIALPVVGIIGARVLDADTVGRPGAAFETSGDFVGEGEYGADSFGLLPGQVWEVRPEDELGTGARRDYAFTSVVNAAARFTFTGREVELTYRAGPDGGSYAVVVDGLEPLDIDGFSIDGLAPDPDADPGEDGLTIDAYNPKERFEERARIDVGTPGEHELIIINLSNLDPDRSGTVMGLGEIEVLDPTRTSSLGFILGLLLLVELIGLAIAFGPGKSWVAGLSDRLDTKRTILLSLVVYSVIAIWGFILNAVIEFWFLAFMVATVQGGSQALSRSLYSAMSPTSQSGEFFGFFSIMSKFSALLGPLVFFLAVQAFGSSRPAVLAIIVFFIAGGWLLRTVDVDEGRRVARAADAGEVGDVGG
ncbi:MAG: MFS transporter, partial [Acidimicrobiia bacterium]|nr:MFS transporter [Acidimicrobiia bacterium]